MIEIPRTAEGDGSGPGGFVVIGIGNAGVHLVDRLAMAASGSLDLLAVNTDHQSLSSSIAPRKIAIGARATRGLGAGGDPELGAEAATESLEDIQESLGSPRAVFICAGLGGGTGSGAAPVIARAARGAGALVFALVTRPFSFEGKRRSRQASESLAELAAHCDAIITFDNDRMSEVTAPKAGIEETFAASDAFLAGCVGAISSMVAASGPIRIGIPELVAAFRGSPASCLFGAGESDADNRAHEALARALKNPLLDRGRLLSEARTVLVHLSGPASLSFAEVQAIMQEMTRLLEDDARIFLGVDASLPPGDPVRVVLLGTGGDLSLDAEPVLVRQAPEETAPRPARRKPAQDTVALPPESFIERAASAEAAAPESEPAQAEAAPPKDLFGNSVAKSPRKFTTKAKQETLQLDPVARGRFEKSEPTIIEGEDLDVPTFLRLKIKLK